MEKNEIIRQWLNEGWQNYQAGVKLFLQYASDPALIQVFLEPHSTYKEKLLVRALQDLLVATPAEKDGGQVDGGGGQVVETTYPAGSQKSWPAAATTGTDPVLASLHAAWKPVFLEMHSLSQRIYDVALAGLTDTNKRMQACQMVHRMLDLDDQCGAYYAKRDYYLQHGQLPAEAITTRGNHTSDPVGDPVRWVTLMKNAQRYIREYKIKLKADPTNLKAAARLQHWQLENNKYKKLLKLD